MPNPSLNVTVLGAGAWGKVLAELAIANQHAVTLWSRRFEMSLIEAVQDADVIISALSMKGVPAVIDQLRGYAFASVPIWVSATKGLNPQTCETPSQLWQQALFLTMRLWFCLDLIWPERLPRGLPAATVVACQNQGAAETIQTLLNSDRFRVYTNQDPIGTELGGTLKNVMAIAAGVCDGLNLGTNAKSALLTRALPEMLQVGQALGAAPETFWGLSGLGDLMATCNSVLSRNYRVGLGIAKGQPLPDVLADIGATAEGVNTAKVLIQLAQREKIELPISNLVAQLLAGEIPLSIVVPALMERRPTSEM